MKESKKKVLEDALLTNEEKIIVNGLITLLEEKTEVSNVWQLLDKKLHSTQYLIAKANLEMLIVNLAKCYVLEKVARLFLTCCKETPDNSIVDIFIRQVKLARNVLSTTAEKTNPPLFI